MKVTLVNGCTNDRGRRCQCLLIAALLAMPVPSYFLTKNSAPIQALSFMCVPLAVSFWSQDLQTLLYFFEYRLC